MNGRLLGQSNHRLSLPMVGTRLNAASFSSRSDTRGQPVTPKRKKTTLGSIAVLVLAAMVYGARELGWLGSDSGGAAPTPTAIPAGGATSDDGGIGDLFRGQRSNVMVEAAGLVEKVLPDDTEGSPHQKFILRLPTGHTVLIAHNIDVARRVSLGRGDSVRFRGEYEWNERGGVVHWTHRDPAGRHEDGWIEAGGRRYR